MATPEHPTHRCEGCGEWLTAENLVPPGDGHVVPLYTEWGVEPDLCGPVRPQPDEGGEDHGE